MKLLVAVIQDQDAKRLVNALRNQAFQSTKLASTGGFLKEGNTTLMIGCRDKDVSSVLNIIQQHASKRTRILSPKYPMRAQIVPEEERPVKVETGGAIVFVLPISSFFQL